MTFGPRNISWDILFTNKRDMDIDLRYSMKILPPWLLTCGIWLSCILVNICQVFSSMASKYARFSIDFFEKKMSSSSNHSAYVIYIDTYIYIYIYNIALVSLFFKATEAMYLFFSSAKNRALTVAELRTFYPNFQALSVCYSFLYDWKFVDSKK